MTKMSLERKVKKGVMKKRGLTPAEVLQLQEMLRLINGRKFEAAQIKGNTALVPRGQEVAIEIDAIARLLENSKNAYVSSKLIECGYPAGTKCDINLNTGEIILKQDESESK